MLSNRLSNVSISRASLAATVYLCWLFFPAHVSAQVLRLSSRSAEAQAAFRAGVVAVENEQLAEATLSLLRAAADAMNASVDELTLVLALRYQLMRTPGERRGPVSRLRVTQSAFSDFAAPYRHLAYAKAREQADLAAGLPMQRYLKLQSENPTRISALPRFCNGADNSRKPSNTILDAESRSSAPGGSSS